MAPVRDSFADLELHRMKLEENITELQKSLQLWQIWEAEYEGFKEEILSLGNNPKWQDLDKAGKDYGGSLLNEKEIKDLLDDGRGKKRDNQQVLGLLSRRIEYVQENVKTISRRLEAANEKFLAATVISQPEVRNEEGLPLTEIREELDEDGNVISSSTSVPGDSTPQMLEALRKAGVTGLPDVGTRGPISAKTEDVILDYSNGDSLIQDTSTVETSPASGDASPVDTANDPPASIIETSQLTKTPTKTRKKTVTFAEDTKPSSGDTKVSTSQNKVKPRKEAIRLPFHDSPPEFISEKDEPGKPHSPTLIPVGESPEDASMRSQMLQYSMNEVGAIVAEMDIDESDSYTSCSDDEENEDEYDSSIDEDEDEYGRTKRPVIDDNYRKQMQELEKKLNARMVENLGPSPMLPTKNIAGGPVNAEQAIHSRVESVSLDLSPPNKTVRFAPEVEVSDARPAKHTKEAKLKENLPVRPIADTIVERSAQTSMPTTAVPAKKFSKFKAVRKGPSPISADQDLSSQTIPNIPTTSSQTTLPTGSNGVTHVRTIVERPPTLDLVSAVPPEPDDLDPLLHQREIAAEYYKLRNRQIQREGGYQKMREESEEMDEDDMMEEDEAGNGKKVSLFRKARMGKLGGRDVSV